MFPTNRQRRRTQLPLGRFGFTLVELLVVIGIIAVLIGILLPALGRARENANKLKCMANMKTLGQAMFMYVGENKGVLPIGLLPQNYSRPSEGFVYVGDGLDWTTLLLNVLNKKTSGVYGTQDQVSEAYAGSRAVFLCPTVTATVPTASEKITHYSSHPRLIPDMQQTDSYALVVFGNPVRGLKPYKLAQIKRSQEIGVIFEGTQDPTSVIGGFAAHSTCNGLDKARIGAKPYLTDVYSMSATQMDGSQPVDMNSGVGGWTTADLNKDTVNNAGNVRFRHVSDTQTNVLMVDGHVETFKFNKTTGQCDLLRRNVCVNPQK